MNLKIFFSINNKSYFKANVIVVSVLELWWIQPCFYQRLANLRKGGVLYLILLDEFYVMSRSRDNKRSYWTLETFYSMLNTLNGRKNNSSRFLNGHTNMSSLIHQMDVSFVFVQIIEPSWKKYVHNIALPSSVSLHFTKDYPGGRLQGLT